MKPKPHSLVQITIALLLMTFALHAETSEAPQKSEAIPWSQIGSKAEAQYNGDGLSVSKTENGAVLRCLFQKLEGEATSQGLWLTSTVGEDVKDRFSVVASAVGRQVSATLPANGIVETSEKTVRFVRAGLVEEYSVSMDGVRQDFILSERPEGAGELKVELAVAGARVEAMADGARLVLEGSGRKIAYSRLHVVDATGRELSARIEVAATILVAVEGAHPAARTSTGNVPTPLFQDTPESAGLEATALRQARMPAATKLAVFVNDTDAVYPIRIDPTFSDTIWIGMGSSLNNRVRALAVSGTNLYVGGDFTMAGGQTVNGIAKWNGTNWSALGSGVNGRVLSLAVSGSDLYAGGDIRTAGGFTAKGVAKWNGSSWSALGSGLEAEFYAEVYALALSGNDLYVGGKFTNAGGIVANNIAKWNGSSWSALGAGLDNRVYDLVVSGTNLYAGGSFRMAGGIGAKYIAVWNGSSWSALGSEFALNNQVAALAVFGRDLYVGGSFSMAGGRTVNRIAKWDGNSWSALGSGFGTGNPNDVIELTLCGSDLYVGGYFTNAGGIAANNIAKWNGSSWSALGSGLGSFPLALATSGTNLYAGGDFGKIMKATVTIGQTITFATLPNITPADSPLTLTATASSGLAVTLTVVSGPATLNGKTLTITGEGTVTIEATQLGNAHYAPAMAVTQSFVVAKQAQSITFAPIPNKIYGNSPFTLNATASSGLGVTFNVVTGSATVSSNTLTIIGAGDVTIEASQRGNTRYAAAPTISQSFSVSKATATIQIDASDKAFDGAAKSVTAQTTPTGLKVNLTYNGSATAPSAAGTYAVLGTISNANYQGSTNVTMLIGYQLTTAAFQGTITRTPNRAVHVPNTSVTLNASNNTGVPFAGWFGDVPVAGVQTRPLTITMDGNKSIRAIFFLNTAGPTGLTLEHNWFYDNLPVNTSIGKIVGTDPDAGDFLNYSLVPGVGDTNNANFSVVGNELRTATTFNYDTIVNKTLLIRVRAADVGGLKLERVFELNLVDATPFVRFEPKSAFTYAPSYVNAIFQLTDRNTNGMNFPKQLAETPGFFRVFENGTLPQNELQPSESSLLTEKLDEVPAKIKTVLLLDNSFSVGLSLNDIKRAATNLVNRILPKQEIAIYSFSNGKILLQDFTNNPAVLKAAIGRMVLGATTTDLYGSTYEVLDKWTESFSLSGIQTGFIVILTDGADTTGRKTLAEVMAKRDLPTQKKKIFTVGVGSGADGTSLDALGNAGYHSIDQYAQLDAAFDAVQQGIQNTANSFYWVNYASPRQNTTTTFTIALKNNLNTGIDSVLNASFKSTGFEPLTAGVAINRRVTNASGITTLSLSKTASLAARAFTMFPLVTNVPIYQWTAGDSSLLKITSLDNENSRVLLVPAGIDGRTTLTLKDTVNYPYATNYTKTVTVVIGSGIAPPRYKLTTSVSPSTAGTITASPTAPTNMYYSGTVVTLNAAAKPGYKFLRWSGASTATTNRIVLTMSTNKSVSAVFTSLYKLSAAVSPLGAGTITTSPYSSSNTYPAGTVVALNATSNSTNIFAAWTGAVLGVSNRVSLTMSANKSVTALFNNPGSFIFQSTNGQMAVWFMQNTNRIASVPLNNNLSAGQGLRLAGAAHFDSNRFQDLVFQGTNGQATLWRMSGNNKTNAMLLRSGTAMPLSWKLVAAADLNKDLKADLLWQNSNGALQGWLMNGTAFSSAANLSVVIPTGSRVAAAANFDTNSAPDYVLQNANGSVTLWLMNGLTRTSTVNVNSGFSAGTGWLAIGATDINNDGKSDIIFQRSSDGALMVWFMNGTAFSKSVVLPVQATAGWTLRAVK